MNTSSEHIIKIDAMEFYKIELETLKQEFFMQMNSPSDHWFFISSLGALTLGRVDYERALFPYETVDKIIQSKGHTGSFSQIEITKEGKKVIWEPFQEWTNKVFEIRRSIYRNNLGTALIFVEENLSLGFEIRQSWTSHPEHGFIRETRLLNNSNKDRQVYIRDGFKNILPALVTQQVQSQLSSLSDAYKIAKITEGLAYFGLSSLLTDRAVPMEALRVNTVWMPLKPMNSHLSLSFSDPDVFEVFGEKTMMAMHLEIMLKVQEPLIWEFALDVYKDHIDFENIVDLNKRITKGLFEESRNISTSELDYLVSRADGSSRSQDFMHVWHHKSNVLYNIMRGGIPSEDYLISILDFKAFIEIRNKTLLIQFPLALEKFEKISFIQLINEIEKSRSPQLLRIAREYLPFTFSRRHGDPSRPWNVFKIEHRDKKGQAILNYQGNWRDIFQNWEALSMSYPLYLPNFIAIFLNAITQDGYNPYKIGRNGIDWEKPEPDHPWSNIGYWSDHQIVYLSRLLELSEKFFPGQLFANANLKEYAWANIPYRIVSKQKIFENPRDTIIFDWESQKIIEQREKEKGSDGKLCQNDQGEIILSSFMEKMITLLVAKFGNYIPGMGIWMNTQRPEWNDANNALVGFGVSVVTLAQLIRFLKGLISWTQASGELEFTLSKRLAELMKKQSHALDSESEARSDAAQRYAFVDSNIETLSIWRSKIYESECEEAQVIVSKEEILRYFIKTLASFEASLKSLEREDGLFESYLIVNYDQERKLMDFRSLSPMLEGQVAVLGALSFTPKDSIKILQRLFSSNLWVSDRKSFLLYPWKDLESFPMKNKIEDDFTDFEFKEAQKYGILASREHFDSEVVNSEILFKKSEHLSREFRDKLSQIYEKVFNHKEFTGRSGTMYAYEGLGSVYWHMVAKLLLAIEELWDLCPQGLEKETLKDYYFQVREGIGYKKSPEEWGAFPWEPYSHTPKDGVARQPGMTGQVKEEILTRFREFGLYISNGSICFSDSLLLGEEEQGIVEMSICGLCVRRNNESRDAKIELVYKDGRVEGVKELGRLRSKEIFERNTPLTRIDLWK